MCLCVLCVVCMWCVWCACVVCVCVCVVECQSSATTPTVSRYVERGQTEEENEKEKRVKNFQLLSYQ